MLARWKEHLTIHPTAMRTGGIKPGDLVKCDIKGRIFHAEVLEKDYTVSPTFTGVKGALRVRPLDRRITYGVVKPTEVVCHWARRKS